MKNYLKGTGVGLIAISITLEALYYGLPYSTGQSIMQVLGGLVGLIGIGNVVVAHKK